MDFIKRLELKIHRMVILTAAAVAALAILAGCGTAREPDAKASGAEVQIVTSFYPMYVMAINITDGIPGVAVSNMTEPQTGCLHDYTFSTKDMKKLSKADFFVVNGAGMESFLDKVLEQQPDLKIVEASQGIDVLTDSKTGEVNPHIWVGISGAIAQAENIGKKLAEGDSAHASQYRENTQAYVKKLEELRGKMHEKLDKLENKNIITFHEAFPYFAKEFNLDIKAVVEREPGTEPSAGQLAETVDIVRKTGVKALFAEPQYSQKAAETIAKETGARVYILDPVVTGEANGDKDAYLKAMENNLKTLEEALSANE